MKKILVMFLILTSVTATAQSTVTFNTLVYSEKEIHRDSLVTYTKRVSYNSSLTLFDQSSDISSMNLQETMYRESTLGKERYICRLKTGELVILAFMKIRHPSKQKIVVLYIDKRIYYLLNL